MLGALLGANTSCLTTPEAPFKMALVRLFERRKGRVGRNEIVSRLQRHPGLYVWGWDVDPDEALSSQQRVWSVESATEALVKAYARRVDRKNAKVWVDQTAGNIRVADTFFREFPDLQMIHLLRDGRAVTASVLRMDLGPTTVDRAARWWMGYVAQGLAAESHYGPERVHRVRYEDLLSRPEQTLRGVCDFLSIPYRAGMIRGDGLQAAEFTEGHHQLVGQAPDPSRATAWRQSLSRRNVEIFENLTGDLLPLLGYPLEHGNLSPRMRWHEILASYAHQLIMRPVSKIRTRLRRRKHGFKG